MAYYELGRPSWYTAICKKKFEFYSAQRIHREREEMEKSIGIMMICNLRVIGINNFRITTLAKNKYFF